jgi:ATPase subunit of ABC transporter with duplicated ATPase domains
MISASNVTVQFGEKPLFDDVSVKFGNGHRYGLIGANGSGKTTFMKVLGGELEPTHGNVSVVAHARVGKLRQDQFAFEEYSVLHTVIMGHERGSTSAQVLPIGEYAPKPVITTRWVKTFLRWER